ncbi:CaiB/BaiF CoA transferase family protein [Pseudaestuariivita atlantica]|uniref:Acyl-CoA transferase n=1 Tax=Pseudaestuariivita atlantica TaxID=1317121 RepID=A0A0L1JL37_9RHOB|nr:CoA transferase [Pseudaestuariivita atlantica]KNG92460.1 acyl-CoA transferase [Pseudaestuariivita atlantica]
MTDLPPLHGLRVVDLSRLVAGNVLTHVLADFGADVVKVEKPGRGDDLRAWRVAGVSTFWAEYCRNKRSLALDTRAAEGMAALTRLIDRADVLVENFRPGTLEAMGLAPDTLLSRNPGLVIARISGWGQTGAWAARPGFGSLVEALSGFAAMTGFPDRPPVLPPLALADMVAGQSGATAVMMALRARDRDGTGQVLDISLFEAIFSVLGPQAMNYHLTGTVPPRMGSLTEITAPRNIYATDDGKYVALSASTQAMAERLFRLIGRADMIDDPRFATNTARVAHIAECDAPVAAWMAGRSAADVLEACEAADVTVGLVADMSDLQGHPFIESRGVLTTMPSGLPTRAVTPRMGRTPGTITHDGPALGAHTRAVLEELGLDAGALIAAGVAAEA